MNRRAVGIKMAAELLSVSPSTVREAVRAGELTSFRFRGRVLESVAAIDALVANGQDGEADRAD